MENGYDRFQPIAGIGQGCANDRKWRIRHTNYPKLTVVPTALVCDACETIA